MRLVLGVMERNAYTLVGKCLLGQMISRPTMHERRLGWTFVVPHDRNKEEGHRPRTGQE